MYKFKDKDIIKAYNNSNTQTEFLNKLGIKSKWVIKTVKEAVKRLKLNLKKFKDYQKQQQKLATKHTDKKKAKIRRWNESIRKRARKKLNKLFKGHLTCIHCGYDKHCEVAHIKAVSSFKPGTKGKIINLFSNLIPLCPNCHYEYDHNMINLEKDIKKYQKTYKYFMDK